MKTKVSHPRRSVAYVINGMRTLPGFRRRPVLYVRSAVQSRQHREEFASVQTFVLFVGHPRSGHSLVGSLLDAHPNVVVSHELDALMYVGLGYSRGQLFTLVLEHARANAAAGRKSWGYSYAVPGQWQGRHERLEVVGDKRGRRSTARLARDPRLLDELASVVDVPVSVVQVVRNPWDNIATMWRRGSRALDEQIDEYFSLSETVDRVAASVAPERFHRLWLEDLIADPRSQLAALCQFVGVDPSPEYLEACASIVLDSPKRTRDGIEWTPGRITEIERRIRSHAWLARYAEQASAP